MKKKNGFTLIELLVVMAVIALLLSILIPVLRGARRQAYKLICANREKNILLGLTIYANNNNLNFPKQKYTIGPDGHKYDLAGYCCGMGLLGQYYAIELMKNIGVDTREYRGEKVPEKFIDSFYCPANSYQQQTAVTFSWTKGENWPPNDSEYWQYSIGYNILVNSPF